VLFPVLGGPFPPSLKLSMRMSFVVKDRHDLRVLAAKDTSRKVPINSSRDRLSTFLLC
jgi:hypothetical protein